MGRRRSYARLLAVRRLALVLFAVLVTLPAGACGGERTVTVGEASLMLDFTPNAVHVGIYTATAREYDRAVGLELDVRTPSEATDAVRLLESGRIRMAILSISDLAIARERGSEIVGVMPLVQRPLAAVLARPGVRSPRDLEGRRAGVAGLPSDEAVLDSVVRGAGGDPERVRRTTIGFNAVPALVGGRVDAVTAFWNAEGVALREQLPAVREFRVEAFGAPAYPELVLCATTETVQDAPGLVRRTVEVLRRGYEEALRDPESAVQMLVDAAPGLERERVGAELRAVSPAFTAGVPRYGMFDPDRLEAWSRWAAEFGIVDEQPDADATFVTRFAAIR
jgi:putative hydroxymethylpyrimidine transport system substrate-binding protein